MELKELIKETIIQITEGLGEGHNYVVKNKYGTGIPGGFTKINFDVAVSSDESKTNDVGGKITVATVFSAGGKHESEKKYSNLNRIQFMTVLDIITDGKPLDFTI